MVRHSLALILLAGFLASPLLAQSGKETLSLADLIEKVEPSCVRIDVSLADGQGVGSGFVINEAGWVATNYHVVAGGKTATVTFSDKKSADVEGVLVYDKRRDLAIIKIKSDRKLKALPLAKETPRKGESSVAIGTPRGLSFSATEGIVSAVRPGKELEELGADVDGTWLQTTTPISPGNSGGPLLNYKGEVVGANTLQLIIGQNINFAISSLDVADLMATAGKSKLKDLATIEPLPSKPRPGRPPMPPPGSPRAPSIPTVAVKLPAQRKFTHRYKVNKEVDAFDKDVTLRTDWIPLEHSESRLLSCGLQVTANFNASQPPSLVTWEFGTTAKKWIFFGQQAKLQMLLDGQTADFGEVQNKPELGTGLGSNSTERLTVMMPLDRFLRVILAKDVKGKIGTMEFPVSSMQLECLRDLASQMSTGKTADSRFDVGRLAIEEDPTAPPSLARKAAASAANTETKPADPEEQEKRAASKLRLAKLLMNRDLETGKKNLREIIETYPGTKAAKEAEELLKNR